MDATKAEIASRKNERTIVFPAADGTPPDLLITCGSTTFVVHEAILAPQSGFIALALALDVKERKERTINAPEQDPTIMKALIHFAYTGTYWDRGGNEPSAQPRLIVNAKVYALAEEYQCPTLKQYAIAQFKDATADHDDVLDVEAMIRLVYTTTPADDQGLREQLIRTVMRDYRWWRAREGFQQALETMPRFCQSVLSRLEHKATLPPDALNDASTCPTCHTADYEMYHGQIVHPCKSCHQMINRRWF